MYKLEKTYKFSSAHKLKDTENLVSKRCCNVHGHMWQVKIIITTNQLKDTMVIDFGKLKNIIDKFDHKYLNDIVLFNPTAENLAEYVYTLINEEYIKQFTAKEILKLEYKLKITVEESPGAKVTYYE